MGGMEAVAHREEDGASQLELGSDIWRFPLTVEQAGRECLVYFSMTPYTPHELKIALSDAALRFRSERGQQSNVRMEPADPSLFIPLFDRHFVEMGPVENGAKPDALRAFVDRNPQLKIRVVTEGYGGVVLDTEDLEVGPGLLRVGDHGPSETEIKVRVVLQCKEHNTSERLVVSHFFRPETEQDVARYQRATSASTLNTRQVSWKRSDDYDLLERIYGEMVTRLDGAVMNGELCEETNRKEWISRVPLWHKTYVLEEVFRRNRVKNG